MQTVIGLFKNANAAQEAKQQLLSNGFSAENIDVTTADEDYGADGYATEPAPINVYQNNASSDMSINASTTGTLEYPSVGSDTNGSSSATKDESFGTKVSNFFGNLFGNDDDEADRYSKAATKNGNLVTVHAQSTEDASRAADILDENGAIDVNEDETEMDYATTLDKTTEADTRLTDDDTIDSFSTATATNVDGDTRFRNAGNTGDGTYGTNIVSGLEDDSSKLNVIKEDVSIGKKEVETGGVRLRSRIVERPVEEQLRLREEKVRVVRTPVDRAATTSDFQNFKEGVIEMTEHAEVAEVTKQARIVEEIKLSKEVNERTQNVSETARDTEVDVEEIEPTNFSSGKIDQ